MAKAATRDLLDSTALAYGEGERTMGFRVHLCDSERVAETLLVTAPDPDDAAEALAGAERLALALDAALHPGAEYRRVLVEPIVPCCEEGCENVIITADPRTSRTMQGEPIPLPDWHQYRCLGCGARRFIPGYPQGRGELND